MVALSIGEINDLVSKNEQLLVERNIAREQAEIWHTLYLEEHALYRRGTIVLNRETCDWVIDEKRDTAICRTHGEICDGVDSAHFPGRKP